MAETVIPFVAIVLVLFLVILGIAFYSRLKMKKRARTDYYNLFIIGVIWLLFGAPMGNFALTALGIVLMVAGLAHRKEWKARHKLSSEERRFSLLMSAAVAIAVVVGIVLFLIYAQ